MQTQSECRQRLPTRNRLPEAASGHVNDAVKWMNVAVQLDLTLEFNLNSHNHENRVMQKCEDSASATCYLPSTASLTSAQVASGSCQVALDTEDTRKDAVKDSTPRCSWTSTIATSSPRRI